MIGPLVLHPAKARHINFIAGLQFFGCLGRSLLWHGIFSRCLPRGRLEFGSCGYFNRPYRVNGGEYRTLADNLSTSKNYTLAASATALGLASNERVTEVMFVFGQAPAGFAQVEKPYLHCTAVANLASTSFVNVADVGGVYNGQWVQAVSRWVTTVYGKPVIPTLPRTGY